MSLWPAEIDLTRYVKPGDTVSWSHGGAEPVALIRQLLDQRHAIGGPISAFLTGASFSDVLASEHADVIRFKGIGGLTAPRALTKAGKLQVLPRRYSDFPGLIRSGLLPVDVLMATVSPPDADGFVNLGVTVALAQDILSRARVAIAEINPNMPRVGGETRVPLARFEAAIWSERSLVMGPSIREDTSAVTEQICANIAGLIDDGATIQIGIGSIGVKLPKLLTDRRDLGIHSGILTDGLMELMLAGVANGAAKNIDHGVAVAGELIGSERLYRFVDDNSGVALRSTSYLLAPAVFASLDNLVSINSAIEVDLSGQVNAETLGGRNIGAIGGQIDFVRGASLSSRGRSIIALPSRAAGGASRIVSCLGDNIVTTPRSEVGFIVTEYGVADLRAKTVPERAEALAAIAHPDHRADLLRAASTRLG